MKILWLINKVSSAVFAHRFVILVKGIVHDGMVIRAGERSFVNYYWFHTLKFTSFYSPRQTKKVLSVNPTDDGVTISFRNRSNGMRKARIAGKYNGTTGHPGNYIFLVEETKISPLVIVIKK